MIATECSGCGRLEVVSAIPASTGAGHHAIPEDPDADWICYGTPVEVTDGREVTILDAFADRSVYGLEPLQPTKASGVAR